MGGENSNSNSNSNATADPTAEASSNTTTTTATRTTTRTTTTQPTNSDKTEPAVISEGNGEREVVATMVSSTTTSKPPEPVFEELEDPEMMDAEIEQEILNEVEFVDQNDNFDDEFDAQERPQSSNNPLSYSLATSPNTPLWAKIFLPILCLSCHAIFYYGQTAAMWKLRTFAEIDAWANATDFTSRKAFDTVGLPHEMNFKISEDKDVETFTYYYAIDHLWVAKGLPGKTLPRAAAILLVIFSGFWPHIKLLLLNVTWFCGKYPTRTKHLQWLSTLGKWSLADVLVVCVMVGVLHLDWIVVPQDIKEGVITDLPQIIEVTKSLYDHRQLCDKLLKLQCGHEKNLIKKTKCHACWTLVDEAYSRPEWARTTGATILKGVKVNGGGIATLRVVGMKGIYAFSAAVILSILLSFVIDVFDHKAKSQGLKDPLLLVAEGHRRGQRERHDLALSEEDALDEPLLNNSTEPEPLEVDLGDFEAYRPPRNIQDAVFALVFFLLTSLTSILIFYGVDVDTMERQVKGAGPMMLHDILGVDWNTNYSLKSLMWTTGAAGSWDYLLMGTFALFIVLGPTVRAGLLETVTLFYQCHRPVSVLSTLIKFVGPFCAWEVFAIAIVMTQLLMPMITNTIIDNPACASISDDGSCLQVEFNILPYPFSAIVAGWILLCSMSNMVINRAANAEDATAWMRLTSAMETQESPGDYHLVQDTEGDGNEPMQEGQVEQVARIVQV
ncbi:unnamed protein product [Cylindrotheca closterium]|uniref:Uncharacterized protein n=1 Tax=Cylindrotheca closterium TaxID=2856 RepID=A0AAD2FR13_9STRA|nr:unnamed protein product [Cylindrotheca closterium]